MNGVEHHEGIYRVTSRDFQNWTDGLQESVDVFVTYTSQNDYMRTIIGTVVAVNSEELHILQTGGFRESWWPEMVTLDFGKACGPIGTVVSWSVACESCGGLGRA